MNYLYLLIPIAVILLAGIRIVKPTQRGLIVRLGKHKVYANPGFHWIFPVIDRIYTWNVTEQIVDTELQELLTYDNLYTSVNAQVNFKVKADEESIKGLSYNVSNYKKQIVELARTSLHNIIGTITYNSANSKADNINDELYESLNNETQNWGIEIVRTEMKEIDPPVDLQENNMAFLPY